MTAKAQSGDLDSLAVLLRSVMEDGESRRQLRYILKQPAFHRRSLLNTAIEQMQIKGENGELIRALGQLKQDAVAVHALTLLEG